MRTRTEKNTSPLLVEKLLVYLVVITLFTNIQSNYYVLIGLAGFWLYEKRYRLSWGVLKDSRIFIAICIYLAVLIVSFLYTENYAGGLKALEKKSSLIILPILLTGIYWDQNLKNNAFKCFVASTLVLTAYSIVSTLGRPGIDLTDMAYFSWVLPESSALGANYYSLFLTFAILILIFEFKTFQRTIPKALIISGILYLTIFLAMLASRTAIISTILILLIFATRNILKQSKRDRNRGLLIFGLTVALSVVLVASVPYLNSRFLQSVYHYKNDPRYELFQDNLNVIKRNPVLGVGIGDVQGELIKEHLASQNMEAYAHKYNAHNDWLQIMIGTGLCYYALR